LIERALAVLLAVAALEAARVLDIAGGGFDSDTGPVIEFFVLAGVFGVWASCLAKCATSVNGTDILDIFAVEVDGGTQEDIALGATAAAHPFFGDACAMPKFLAVGAVLAVYIAIDNTGGAFEFAGPFVATETTFLAVVIGGQDTGIAFVCAEAVGFALGAVITVFLAECNTFVIFQVAVAFFGAIAAILAVILAGAHTNTHGLSKVCGGLGGTSSKCIAWGTRAIAKYARWTESSA
jgi:hypothetical protein